MYNARAKNLSCSLHSCVTTFVLLFINDIPIITILVTNLK